MATDYSDRRIQYTAGTIAVGSSYQAVGIAPPRDKSLLETHSDDLESLAAILLTCVQNTRILADRYLGSEPESIDKLTPPQSPVQPPLVHKLTSQTEILRGLLASLQHNIERLERC